MKGCPLRSLRILRLNSLFFNRKVRKGMRKGRKENVQFLPVYCTDIAYNTRRCYHAPLFVPGTAMKFSRHYFVLVCLTSVFFLMCGCRNDSSQTTGRGEGFNLLRPQQSNNPPPRREIQRRVQSEDMDRIRQSFQEGFSPSSEKTSQNLRNFGLLIAAVVLVAAGVTSWQLWRRRQAEWALNDPMALIKELNYVHQLSDLEKRLMQELSQQNALPTPLKLFVEPKFLLDALESGSFVAARSSVRQLLSKLFDITAEGSETSGVLTDSSSKHSSPKQGLV